jgi:hypothetical protein
VRGLAHAAAVIFTPKANWKRVARGIQIPSAESLSASTCISPHFSSIGMGGESSAYLAISSLYFRHHLSHTL